MKNIKQTLAATLSVLAMTFTGTAFADGMDRQHHKKGFNSKSPISKQVNRQVFQNGNKRKTVKRVIVKKAQGKKVFVTHKSVKKHAQVHYVTNKRFNQGKRYNKRVSYQNRRYSKDRQNRFKAVKAKKRFVYSVRRGDTLYRISLKTGVSINKLARLNRLKHGRANHLQIGQILRLV